MKEDLNLLTTESRNERSMRIDTSSPLEILRIMNEEDQKVALAVQDVLPDVEKAVGFAVSSFKKGLAASCTSIYSAAGHFRQVS